jgi:hypothetical protein
MSCNGCLLFKDCYDKYPGALKPPCASKNFERNDSGGVEAKIAAAIKRHYHQDNDGQYRFDSVMDFLEEMRQLSGVA